MSKVLVVEDDHMLRTVYKEILGHKGYDVYIARDGVEALNLVNEVRPDVVLLDILMPNMDGLAFLKKSHIKRKHPDTVIIAFSNLSNADMLNKMLESGADMHILKSSLSPKQLLSAVEAACKETIRHYNLHTV